MLRREFRIRASQHLGDVGLGLVILDHAAGAAQIVADEMGDELDEGLPVVEDFRFERVSQNRIGNDQHQNGGDPAGEQDGDDDVVTFEPVAIAAFQTG